VVIGISLGASQSPDAAKALFIALMFHQCFEGLGLGGCIAQVYFLFSIFIIYSFNESSISDIIKLSIA